MTTLPDLLSLPAAARELSRKGLRVTARTLREAVRRGTLPASKIGREIAVTAADLTRYAAYRATVNVRLVTGHPDPYACPYPVDTARGPGGRFIEGRADGKPVGKQAQRRTRVPE